MDGKEIINSFKKETIYLFSEAIPILHDKIYFVFKADIIAIEANPSKTKMQRIKKYIKRIEKTEAFISQLDIEPIAYILKHDNESNYQIEAIDEKYNSFIEKNRTKLLKDFLEEIKT